MKINKIFITICLLIISFAGCKQDVLKPLPNDGSTPNPIKDAIVENMPGAAMISYTLPDDASLLYVKAEYELNGVKMEAKSSFYKKNIVIEGFGDTLKRTINLYSVSRGEKVSTPVAVQIQPLRSPGQNAFHSIKVKESFGGFNLSFNNPGQGSKNIVIVVLQHDAVLNEWKQIDAYYSGLESGTFSTRGLSPVNQLFGFYVKDRWDNKTDTLKLSLTPVYEEMLDGTKFVDSRKKFPIPQMLPLPVSGKPLAEIVDYNSTYVWKNLFDGNTGTMFHTKQNYDQPSWLPFDLTKITKLSRYKLWQRPTGYLFNHGNPHEWEIWGTNDPTDVNSWVRLDHRVMIKPSGLPLGSNSNDDVEIGTAGQEYEFPEDTPAVRYISWKNIDSWGSIEGSLGFLHLQELTFWGQVQ
jgi:hypothetical protein